MQCKHGLGARHPGLLGESRLVSGNAGCVFRSAWGLPYPGPSVYRLPAGQPSGREAGQAGGRTCHLLNLEGLLQINLDILN